MHASILDLRYHMNDVLKALERKEEVEIFCNGKYKGTIIPKKISITKTTQEHPFFGIAKRSKLSVEKQMNSLRGDRYNAI